MSSEFTEDEMRRALGLGSAAPANPSTRQPSQPASSTQSQPRAGGKPKLRPAKLRVTLLVSKEFEGESVEFTHEADTLSHFDAEQQAKEHAKKAKFRYFELLSIKSTE